MQRCRWILAVVVFLGTDSTLKCGEQSGRQEAGTAVTRASNVVEEFDVAPNGDLIMIPVTIGGQQFKFVVDTGCNKTLLDETLPIFVEPTGRTETDRDGTNPSPLFHVPDAFVGASRLPLTGDTARRDLSGFRKMTALPISGLVGMNFLKAYVVRIDFDAGKFSLLQSVPESSGSEFKLTRSTWGHPKLDVEAGGRVVPFLVDTGNFAPESCAISNRRFAELFEDGHIYDVGPRRPAINADGPTTSRRARLDRLRVGDFEVQNVFVCEAHACLLGLPYLSRYVVTFDFPNDRLYLKEGARFAEPTRYELSGMWIKRLDTGDKIVSISKTGPAPDAGIQVDDRVLKVDGKNSSEFSQFELRRIFTEYGRKVHVVMERDGEQFEVDLALPTKVKPAQRTFSGKVGE